MVIKGIVRHADRHSSCYDTSAITLSDALAYQGVQDLILCLEDNSDIKYIDLMRLYAEQPVAANGVTNWEKMTEYLTKLNLTTLDRYRVATMVPYKMLTIRNGVKTLIKTPFSTNITTQLNIYSVENNFGIDVGYGSHRSPEIRNNPRLKWNLPDLVFSKSIPGDLIEFKNTIPFVNGIACYPEVYKDVLFAYQGAQLAAKVSDLNKNILLVDYSNLGDLTIVKLSDCKPVDITGVKEKTSINDTVVKDDDFVKFEGTIQVYQHSTIKISFLLPEGIKSGYPMVCIGGRMFEPSTDHVKMFSEGARYRVEVELDRQLLEIILAANLQKFKQTIKNTTIVRVSVEDLIDNLFKDPDLFAESPSEEALEKLAIQRYADKTVPFIAILHSKEPLVHNTIEPLNVLYPDKLLFPSKTGGLLINRYTREVVDYVRVQYDSNELITFPVQQELRLMHRDNLYDLVTPNIAIRKHNTSYTDKYNPFSMEYTDVRRLSAYLLYDLTVARLPIVTEDDDDTGDDTPSTPDQPVEPVEYLPIITRVDAGTIHVENIGILHSGNYTLLDVTTSGTSRVWKLANSIYPDQLETIVAYDTSKSRWYIGTESNHLYETNVAHGGSSPWHSSLVWYTVK